MILSVTWSRAGGGLSRPALEGIGAARRLADALGREAAAVALGPDAAAAAAAAARHGVARAVAVEGDLDARGAEAYVATLAALARDLGAEVVLLPADARGREVGPRLAGRLGGAAVNDVVELRVEGGRPVWTRPVFGGKAFAAVVARRAPVVATLRPGAFEPAEAAGGEAPVERREPVLPEAPVRLRERAAEARSGPRLEEARVVVSGGRGLGGPEAFRQLEELARLLGGAVGASLAAVDEGWAPPEWQVGQTGKVVSPDVYIAVGISGASQHLAGIAGAKAIVAINKDPNAPIFEAARFGIVMDYRQILPALIEECRKLAG